MKDKPNRREFLATGVAAILSPIGFSCLMPALGQVAERRTMTSTRRVLILGAGLAGLAAAYELDRLGYETTVLEAQMHPGGRVKTLREAFSDGLYAEAGAMAIADTDHLTLGYVKEFDLSLQKMNPSGTARRFFARGRWIDEASNAPYSLNSSEKRLGVAELYTHYTSAGIKQLGNIGSTAWSPSAYKEIDQLTITQLLTKHGASTDAIEFLKLTELGAYGDGVQNVSALAVLVGESHYMNSENYFAIKGGNDLLPAAFGRRLADKIHYGAKVTAVVQTKDVARVTVNHVGTDRVFEADAVICAVPLAAMKKIKFVPPLSPGKQRAMDEIRYASVSRVYLQARTRVWQKYYPTARVTTDKPPVTFEDHTEAQTASERGIVESHTYGVEARRVASLTASGRLALGVKHLEKIFPGFASEFEGGTSKCWDTDESSAGAYVDFKPGQMSAHFEHLAAIERHLYFAGEHTSKMFASMEGALESGQRVANEIRSRSSQ